MTTFAEDEASVEASEPREGLEIRHGYIVYRIATGSRDIEIDGKKFFAATGARSEIAILLVKQDKDITIQLPANHPFVLRWNRGGVPPKTVTASVYRKQLRSGDSARIWFGDVVSLELDGHVAKFAATPSVLRALKRNLPTIAVSQSCPYILYGAGCKKPRTGFRVATTVASHDGPKVTVATMSGHPDQWAQFGELVHVPSGERMTISDQTGAVLTLQLPIGDLKDGDAIEVYAGCAHDPATCRDKFDNLVNYGGLPVLPRGNVFLPNGFGIWQSE